MVICKMVVALVLHLPFFDGYKSDTLLFYILEGDLCMNKILIVEDEISISDLIKIELEIKGYKCEVAADGEVAANLIEK